MDVNTFLDNFGTAAETPGVRQRMRGLVLDLAVSGRLVAQDPNDEPASVIVSETASERADLMRNGLVPTPRTMVDGATTTPQFGVPDGWCWTPLDDVAVYVQRGKSPVYSTVPTTVRVVSQKCVQWSGFDPGPARPVQHASIASYGPERFLQAGDLLWNSTGTGTVGRVAVFPDGLPAGRFVADSHVTVIRLGRSLPRYIAAWLSSRFVQDRISELTSGTTQQQELNTSTVRGLRIPLAPFAEQERIVAKVDELLGLCDELDARQLHRRRANDRFRSSALRALTEADAPDDLTTAWECVSANFPSIVNDSDGINSLRHAIVQLAVEGRLVPQDAQVESADELLAVADRRKRELVRDGMAQRRSALELIRPDEYRRQLPPGWALARLDRWCDVAGGVAKGRSLGGRDIVRLPYLRVANVKAGFLLLDEVKTIDIGTNEVARYSLQTGDVLLTEGGDWDKLGRSAVWTGEIDPCLHQNHVFRARCVDEGLMPWWVSLYTNSAAGRTYFQSKAKRTTNLASINMTELRSMPLPVPPAEEQRRIAARVRQLLALCDALEANVVRRRDRHAALSAALTQVH